MEVAQRPMRSSRAGAEPQHTDDAFAGGLSENLDGKKLVWFLCLEAPRA